MSVKLASFLCKTFRILPEEIVCPGGNTSWDKVEVKDGNRICEGQKNICNQTGQLCMFPSDNPLV